MSVSHIPMLAISIVGCIVIHDHDTCPHAPRTNDGLGQRFFCMEQTRSRPFPAFRAFEFIVTPLLQ